MRFAKMVMLRKIGPQNHIKGPDCDWRRGGARRFPGPRDGVSLQDTDRSIDAWQSLVEGWYWCRLIYSTPRCSACEAKLMPVASFFKGLTGGAKAQVHFMPLGSLLRPLICG